MKIKTSIFLKYKFKKAADPSQELKSLFLLKTSAVRAI